MNTQAGNRWAIAAAGIVMYVALGAVYADSVFRDPLIRAYGWTIPQASLTFTIAIIMLGFGAFVGGLWMGRSGPRTVGVVGGVLYGLGPLVTSLAGDRLWLVYLTAGAVSGLGLGLAYIVPLATLVRWFPDRRGFIVGLGVGAYGAGALVAAPVAGWLLQAVGVTLTFAILGVTFLVMVVGGALFMRNPPEGFRPAGWQPAAHMSKHLGGEYTLWQALRTWQWYALAAILFLSASAGLTILSQAAPMTMEITGVSAAQAAGLVGIISIANGAGRLLWAWLSDFVGRKRVYLALFLIMGVACLLLPLTTSFVVFGALAFVILLSFGGGLGVMPALAADYFGEKNLGAIYGLMLTVWGFSSLPGPLLMASVRESTGTYSAALYLIGSVALVSALLPLVLRPPQPLESVTSTTKRAAPTSRAA